MKIGNVPLPSPFALAPMAGMTDTAFRRLVKRKGGCGLVVSEMVSSEGLVRGIDRTLDTRIHRGGAARLDPDFGGDPAKMASAAAIVEGMGADIVDVNMGCPVPKIAKHSAGCSLMKEPAHAAEIVRAMARAVKIPVTVKMRAGWDERSVNAPELARMMEDAGAAAVAVHGRTAAQSYRGESDWDLIAKVASGVGIPVLGSGDCVEARELVDRLRMGVGGILVGRGALRNPWIFQQAAALAAGRPMPEVTLEDRGRFLLEYIDMLLREGEGEAEGFRHKAGTAAPSESPDGARPPVARGRERWVINKLRALGSWYTKGLDGGSHLRVALNSAESVPALRDVIRGFFFARATAQADRQPEPGSFAHK